MDTQKELHHAEPDGNEMLGESSKEVVAGGATDEDEDAEGEDEEDENDGMKEKDEGEKNEGEKEKDEGEKEENEGEKEEEEGEEENEKDEIEDEMETYKKKEKPDVDMEKGKDQVAHSSPIIEDDLVNDEDFMKEMDNNMMNALRDADSDI